jgi:hypothetical protein
MILSFFNKWAIIFRAFGPVFIIPFSLLFTYSYHSKPGIWYGLLIINILIGLSEAVALLILKNARNYYFIRIFSTLATAIPILYTTLIIMNSNYPNSYFPIFCTFLLIMIIEWFLSFDFQKIRLSKALEQKIPNNAINVDEGVVNLQTTFLFSRKDADKSRTEKILTIGVVLLIFAPVIGSIIYRLTTPEQQSMYLLAFLSSLAMVLIFGSGAQAGTASVIKEIEEKSKMRFVIKNLV